MRISSITTRGGKTYHYRARVPVALHATDLANGNDPTKLVQMTLKTKDRAIALARKDIVDSWILNGRLGKVDFISPREHYRQQLEIHTNAPDLILPRYDASDVFSDKDPEDWVQIGVRNEGKPPLLGDDIWDALRDGDIDESDLTQEQLAALVVERGDPVPDRYKYSLRNALRDYRVYREGEIREKGIKQFDRAVAVYLNGLADVALDAIKKPLVLLWLDSIKKQYSQSTRTSYLGFLSRLFDYACDRELCTDRSNPFNGHKLGKEVKKPVQQMFDSELLAILPLLPRPSDRAWAVIARHHGLRLAEVAHAKIEKVEGIVCLNVTEIAEDEWKPKTDAGKRYVPIRVSMIDYANEHLPNMKRPDLFSARFSRRKCKLFPDRPRVLCFHSLRHRWITLAHQQGYTEQQVSWLSGHVAGRGEGEGGKRYMHGYSIAFLSEIIESIPALEGFE
mgnify:CR=1 FL=1